MKPAPDPQRDRVAKVGLAPGSLWQSSDTPAKGTCVRLVRVPGMRIESPNRRRGKTVAGIHARARRDQIARDTVWLLTKAATSGVRGKLLAIHCVRVAPRRLDQDNAISGFKRVIDSVAKALGLDDRTFRIWGDGPGPRLTFDDRSEGVGLHRVDIVLTFEEPTL